MDHMDNPEHAEERAALVAAVIAACGSSGLEPGAIERLSTVIGRLFDIGCEFELEAAMGASAVHRPGEPKGYVDKLFVTFEFPDAKELREEAHREMHAEEIKHERSN